MHLGVAIAFATCDVIGTTTELNDNNIQPMKASQAQKRNVMNVQSMHDWTSLKVGQTSKRQVRAEHPNIGKSLPNLADIYRRNKNARASRQHRGEAIPSKQMLEHVEAKC
jgi:hypothetical protein